MISKNIQVLIIDDEPMWQTTTEGMCRKIFSKLVEEKTLNSTDQINFLCASNVTDAKDLLADSKIHLVLLDKDLGVDKKGKKLNGIDFLVELKSIQPLSQFLVLTSDVSTREIARAIKLGASNYLFKSFDDASTELRLEIIKKSFMSFFEDFAKTKNSSPGKKGLYSTYVCESPVMQRLSEKLNALSETSRPVLILGDTGLGKGAAARRLSEFSKDSKSQSAREFVQLNIGATERNMAEAILFGTEPGAFTDASKQTKAGLLDVARDGDIFLDEVGDASLELQLKLLKVVEEKEYYRVGGNRPIKTNARFIFATNKDLKKLVAEGKFREDLYMRISIFEIMMPKLSDRKEDIPALISGFLNRACAEHKNKQIEIHDLPKDLLEYFGRDEIPGNIRGIENDVERLVAHTKYDEGGRPNLKEWKKTIGLTVPVALKRNEVLNIAHLQTMRTNFIDADFPGLKIATEIFERRIFEELHRNETSIRKGAELLKISTNTYTTKQRQYSINMEGSL